MFNCLPPVTSQVTLSKPSEENLIFRKVWGAHQVYLYGSGTMALAAAMQAIKKIKQVTKPEVLLPGYACPDLVSAAIFSGLKPVLVDLEEERPWLDLQDLSRKITPRTIAVVAAHFLGLPERVQTLRKLLQNTGVYLIEDSAQLFPREGNNSVWQGDVVTLSFNRGKPLGLMGGGAVLVKDSHLSAALPFQKEARLNMDRAYESLPLKRSIRLLAYNILQHEHAYYFISKLKFLGLGKTVYKPLNEINIFPTGLPGLLAGNMEIYLEKATPNQNTLSEMFTTIEDDKIIDLPRLCTGSDTASLLRYPILVENKLVRDNMFRDLTDQGLGGSVMYRQPLPEIKGLKTFLGNSGDLPNATDFANRLISLACHSGVRERHINKMQQIITSHVSKT